MNEENSVSETVEPKVATENPDNSINGFNKLLIILVIIVGMVFVGQYAAQKLIKKPQSSIAPSPAQNTFLPAEITVPAKYAGNPYTNIEPFNVTSFYISMQLLNETGGQTTESMTRTNEGVIENVKIDEEHKVAEITIKDAENHLLRFEYTGLIYDKIVVSSLGVDTNPTLTSLTKGDNIRIQDEYNTRAKSYESSVMSVTIIRL